MNLIEADAKQVLQDAGLPVPPGRRLLADEEQGGVERSVAVKAQLLAGGRGKAGLVRLATSSEFPEALRLVREAMMAAHHNGPVMIEELVDIASEHFLAWRVDEEARGYVLMYSPCGGMEVEEHHDRLVELHIVPGTSIRLAAIARFLADAGVEGRKLGSIARFALDLHRVLVDQDATLIEINPLALTSRGTAIALDAKITLDPNAAPRHLDRDRTLSCRLGRIAGGAIESEASSLGITYVPLDGQVALVTGGAGIGMTLVDMLGDAGVGAANFVDLPGGSGVTIFGDLARLVLRRARDVRARAIIVFFTLSATSLKAPVESILAALAADPPSCPVIVGLVAGGSAERDMTMAQARAAFTARDYTWVDSLDAAVSLAIGAAA